MRIICATHVCARRPSAAASASDSRRAGVLSPHLGEGTRIIFTFERSDFVSASFRADIGYAGLGLTSAPIDSRCLGPINATCTGPLAVASSNCPLILEFALRGSKKVPAPAWLLAIPAVVFPPVNVPVG
jgi:hypothetical protein